MKITYSAIFEYADDGINIRFPDVTNVYTCADDRDEAIAMAKEALELALHGTKASMLPDCTSFSCDDKSEIVPIAIEMEEKNDILYSDGVIEF